MPVVQSLTNKKGIKMARFTVRDFSRALGLKDSRESFTNSGIFLKILRNRGLATVVGKIHHPNGRPSLVYDMEDSVASSIKVKGKRRKFVPINPEGFDVWEVLELVNKARESNGSHYMPHFVFVYRLRQLQMSHKGKKNPYKEVGFNGSTRVFSKKSAFLIAKKMESIPYRATIDWNKVA